MYTTFEKLENGDLKISLTQEGKDYLTEQGMSGYPKKNSDILFWTLIETQLSNGWEFVRPDDIAALTACNILSDEVERNDHGNITKIGKVYAFTDYAVKLEVEELYNNGFCIFDKVEDEE